MPTIGFVILVNPFNPLSQTERLINRLNAMFDFPPVACHLDLGKNPLPLTRSSPNTKFVQPHVDTKWADFSCIEAAILALRLLYGDENGPDWFVYLSGADYPVRRAEQILADLARSPFDAHIEHRLVLRNGTTLPNPQQPEGYKGAHWLRHCHKLYCSRRIQIPWLTRRLTRATKTLWLDQPWLPLKGLPFSEDFRCYAGEAWFCANRKSAQAILNFHSHDREVARHYRKVLVPEESYFQTVLANTPGLKLSQRHFRYIDWSGGGSNPKVLSGTNLATIRNSGAHFARKFESVAPVLDELDAMIA